MKPNCPCDDIVFPPELVIHAGLERLPRQIATFPEFRSALLSWIGQEPALAHWRARGSDDFGIMLLEMWSYVCDCISFYDEVMAQEAYVRTAQLRPSLRKLVALLGYLPRPAVGAKAELALLAEGRQPIVLPPGTAFRSGAFPGSSPQVFELETAQRAHPFTNKWSIQRTRPLTLEPGPLYTLWRDHFLLDPKSVAVKEDQLVLIENTTNQNETRPRRVVSVTDVDASDGARYKDLQVSEIVVLPGYTPVSHLRLTTPTQTASLWRHTVLKKKSGLLHLGGMPALAFDSLQKQIHLGDKLILQKGDDLRWFKVTSIGEWNLALPGTASTTITNKNNKPLMTVTPPPTKVPVTWVILDAEFNAWPRREFGPPWTDSDGPHIQVHFGFRTAGKVTVPADTYLTPVQPIHLTPPVEAPQDGKAPGRFLLEDKDSTGAALTANINFASRSLAPTVPLDHALVAPVTAYGNIVTATRGESVPAEALGLGNGAVANQSFKLKKSPLTYFPSPEGVVSTLRVYVDGLQWTEVPTFFGIGPQEQVYIVRQNDDGESKVTFGDGVRGRRLPTGSRVAASYRFGAGKASPPAGSIHQMAKPVKGISAVRNPVASSGGDDAEPATGLRAYAPRSALLLGRAISIPDMEAAAASVAGVRAVRAEWRWNEARQRPLVQIWYIGGKPVAQDIVTKLKGLSDSVTPVEVDQAKPVVRTLSLSIAIDPKRVEADVLAAVRRLLMDPETGLLAPERIGIGRPLLRSRIFEHTLAAPGALAVNGIHWNSEPFPGYGIQPGAGKYFDLEAGALLLNGKAGS